MIFNASLSADEVSFTPDIMKLIVWYLSGVPSAKTSSPDANLPAFSHPRFPPSGHFGCPGSNGEDQTNADEINSCLRTP
jgi:hypothetical protein